MTKISKMLLCQCARHDCVATVSPRCRTVAIPQLKAISVPPIAGIPDKMLRIEQ